MMGKNFATRLSEAWKVATPLREALRVTVCDPLCEVVTAYTLMFNRAVVKMVSSNISE